MSHVINPLHAYYREDHLQHVIGQMVRRGPPIIRAYFDGEAWHASLTRARYALRRNAHTFSAITVLHPVPLPRKTIPHAY